MQEPASTTALPADLHRAIVEQSLDAILFADRDGVIRLWNRGAEVLFGFGANEAIGQTLDLIVPERFRRTHDEGYRLAINTGHLRHEGRVLTTRSAHKYGCRLYVDFSFGLLKDAGGQVSGVFAIARDCTGRQLEQFARRACPAE
jgi:PAS domain S-box-containing protein